MVKAYIRLLNAYNSIMHKIPFEPDIALVLGSGLGDYAEDIEVTAIINYNEVLDFPVSTVKGHKGRFIFGYIKNIKVVIMQGRVHYYEGYSMEEVVLPIRLLKMMGTKTVLLTNASGSVNKSYNPSDFMLIKDHISSFIPSPLIGPNIDVLGERFSDMSEVYDKSLIKVCKDTALNLNIDLKEGVYIQLGGPNFETAAEVNMCRILGADAVGFSTACEATVANHMGMKVCGISLITNLGCGISQNKLTAEEVFDTATKSSKTFKNLITHIIINICS